MHVLLFVIVLGAIQGFTEFLPISSSGHLALLENLPFFAEMTALIEERFPLLAFNVILHIGTILAVLIFWRRDIIAIFQDFFHDIMKGDFQGKGVRTTLLIFVSMLPLLVVPAIKHHVEEATGNLFWVALFFIYNGFLLVVSDYLFHRRWSAQKDAAKPAEEGGSVPRMLHIEEMKIKDSFIIGLFQGMAIFPGISRSGSTITASLLRGLSGPEAVKFSFIISIPVLIAASALEVYEIRDSLGDINNARWDWIIAGLTSSFLTGIFSLKFLVWLGRRVMFYPFGIYTIILGISLIFFHGNGG